MPKYEVSINETCFYETKEIIAKNEEKAEEKYKEMLDNGEIVAYESELNDAHIELINLTTSIDDK